VASLTRPELAAASRTTSTSASVFSSPSFRPARSASTWLADHPDRRASSSRMASAYSLSSAVAAASMSAVRTGWSKVPWVAVVLLSDT